MKKIALANGLEVTAAALGAMNFGTGMTKEESFAVLDRYVEMGGNFIDTSNNYAHWAGTGDESETVLGEWLKDRGRRDSLVIATKVDKLAKSKIPQACNMIAKTLGIRKELVQGYSAENGYGRDKLLEYIENILE